MDDDLLKTFLEIHKTRHFGKAAENLFITQSAVSARVRQLEKEIGVQLFVRDRNNIRPTPAGEKLVLHAENILNTWNRVKTEVSIEDEDKIPLSIGAVSSLWDIYLNRWLSKITSENENIALTCQLLSSDSINQKISNNTLDLGFTYNPPHEEHIYIIKPLPIKFIMVSSRQGLTSGEAVSKDYIFVDWGTSFSAAHSEHFQNIPSPLIRTDLGRIARSFIKKNGGSAYLPESVVRRDLADSKLYLVDDAPIIERDAYIIRSKKNARGNSIDQILSV